MEFSAAVSVTKKIHVFPDTEPITDLRREGKALQIETIDQDLEFTESESLFDDEKSKSTASSILNDFSWV